jgi:hypothetical protein
MSRTSPTIKPLSSGMSIHMLKHDPGTDVLLTFGVACARAFRGSVPASLAFGRVRGKACDDDVIVILRRNLSLSSLPFPQPISSLFSSKFAKL